MCTSVCVCVCVCLFVCVCNCVCVHESILVIYKVDGERNKTNGKGNKRETDSKTETRNVDIEIRKTDEKALRYKDKGETSHWTLCLPETETYKQID